MKKNFPLSKKKREGHHEQLERNERMVAALAHEIKNPLNSMKGASQYLHNRYPGENEISEFTGIIIEEINRLERFLNEFLSFSRGINLKLTMVNPEEFILGIIMLVKHSFPATIKINVKRRPIPKIFMDQEQMRQVMVNLFSNAADAISKVSKPHAEVTIDFDLKNVYIIVSDNGKGIKEEDIKHVFEPFFTTKESGMGIGLSISKSIVKKHGGTLTATSEKGKMTEFKISIPL